MNRRGFLKFLPALAAIPFLGKLAPKVQDWSMNEIAVRNGHTRYWAGTTIPRRTPWEEVAEADKRFLMASQAHPYAYFYVNEDGTVTAAPMPKTMTIYREAT